MASRKKTPADVEKQVLLQSRRRCCLCFWLEGIDEVVKGQIAHLDNDPSNSKFENLVFLCFNHHNEYDGKTSVSKGLKLSEVAEWRDELYKEMEDRFRSVKSKKLELSIARFLWVERTNYFKLEFKLRNVGSASVRNATVSIRLPDNVSAESPTSPPQEIEGPMGLKLPIPQITMANFYDFYEIRDDFFESNGRVASCDPLPRFNPILLPDHSAVFDGLGFCKEDYPDGAELRIEYRIDAEDMDPLTGTLTGTIPTGLAWLLEDREKYGISDGMTLEELEQAQQNPRDD